MPLPKLGTSPRATFFSDGFRPGSRCRTRCLWAGYHSGIGIRCEWRFRHVEGGAECWGSELIDLDSWLKAR